MGKEEALEIAKAIAQFGLYGENAPSKNRLSYKEVNDMKKEDLIQRMNVLSEFNVTFHFIGKSDPNKIKSIITSQFNLDRRLKNNYKIDFPLIQRSKNEVYVLNNSKILQSHIFIVSNTNSKGMSNISESKLFNTYYGGGFSGILKQEIREYRSLAYSTSGGFRFNSDLEYNNYFFTYIGTQADKTANALNKSLQLINELPKKEDRMDFIKNNIELNISSLYPSFRNLSTEIESYKLNGLKTDPNIEVFNNIKSTSFSDLYNFYLKNIQNNSLFIGIHGDLKRFKSQFDEIGIEYKQIERSDVIIF